MMSGLGRQSHPCSCSLGRAAGSGITRSAEALAAPPAPQPARHIPCCIQSQAPQRRPFPRRYLKKSCAVSTFKEAGGGVRWPRPRAPGQPGLDARRCPDASPASRPSPPHLPQMLSFFWLR